MTTASPQPAHVYDHPGQCPICEWRARYLADGLIEHFAEPE